ncbi:hypothetical protein ACFOEZ_20395 [Tianweitania populi]|uniref:Uncharacterized protein n=1 Tax=Tianweitania populi TaxID=1607949 RepID=A0A8J3DSP3_9HYPH|nr:hypothetical protein [Tianweitania populi]GHD20892.1 hypothetical protein GCM10016234_33920 [Tianweitania populi]
MSTPISGTIEPKVEVGDQVQIGSIGGTIYPFNDDAAILIRFIRIVVLRAAFPTLTAKGDCLFKVVEDRPQIRCHYLAQTNVARPEQT